MLWLLFKLLELKDFLKVRCLAKLVGNLRKLVADHLVRSRKGACYADDSAQCRSFFSIVLELAPYRSGIEERLAQQPEKREFQCEVEEG